MINRLNGSNRLNKYNGSNECLCNNEYQYSNHGSNECLCNNEENNSVSESVSESVSKSVSNTLNYDTIKRQQLNSLLINHRQKSINIEEINKEIQEINKENSDQLKILKNRGFNNQSSSYKREKKRINNLSSLKKNNIKQRKNNLIGERDKITKMMKNIISNKNLETLLNTGNSRRFEIKKNEPRIKMLEYIKIFNKKINKLKKIKDKIETILMSSQLNRETIEKEKISMINDFEMFMLEYNTLVEQSQSLSTIFSVNLEHFLSEEQIKNKVYEDFMKLMNKYKEELSSNRDLILYQLNESLKIRTVYVNMINKDIKILYKNMEKYINGIDVDQVLRESRTILNKILKIKKYKNISLSDEIIDTIDNLHDTFLIYELARNP